MSRQKNPRLRNRKRVNVQRFGCGFAPWAGLSCSSRSNQDSSDEALRATCKTEVLNGRQPKEGVLMTPSPIASQRAGVGFFSATD